MARVMVAGAGGYIGIPLCHKLLEKGHSVVAVDRFFFGKSRIADLNTNSRATIMVEDIRNVTPNMLADINAVIDLAGLSNDASGEIDPELTRSINCKGGMHLARTAKEAGVRRYVYSSSASVYGHGVRERLTETDECQPQTLYPQTLYAESKLRVEDLLGKLAAPAFEIVILRNATVFGPAPRTRFDLAINIMTLRAWKERVIYIMGGGEQWRPFVHVADVVRALIQGVEEDASVVAGEIFNVGGDDMNYQIQQLARFVLDVIPNVVVHGIPDDPEKRTYNLSFAKIKQHLGSSRQFAPMWGSSKSSKRSTAALSPAMTRHANTLQWYRALMEWDRRIKELVLHDRILSSLAKLCLSRAKLDVNASNFVCAPHASSV